MIGIISSVVSGYASQCNLDDTQNDNFYDSFVHVLRKLGEKKIIVVLGDFNDHIGHNAADSENQHGGYGYGVRNKEVKRILEFCGAMNMTVGNAILKKRKTHLQLFS